MEPTTYSVMIHMCDTTATALLGELSELVVFSAVQGSDASALPLVWCVEKTFGTCIFVHWETTYRAYASSTSIASGAIVQSGTRQPIVPGKTLIVQPGPTSMVSSGGAADAITIENSTTSPFTCGIEQTVNQACSRVCVYPLFGQNRQTIRPLPQIVLMFTTAPLEVGEAFSDSALTAALTPSSSFAATPLHVLSIDMAQAPQLLVTVQYDINIGWSWGGAPWGNLLSPSDMVSQLIQPDPPPSGAGVSPGG